MCFQNHKCLMSMPLTFKHRNREDSRNRNICSWLWEMNCSVLRIRSPKKLWNKTPLSHKSNKRENCPDYPSDDLHFWVLRGAVREDLSPWTILNTHCVYLAYCDNSWCLQRASSLISGVFSVSQTLSGSWTLALDTLITVLLSSLNIVKPESLILTLPKSKSKSQIQNGNEQI